MKKQLIIAAVSIAISATTVVATAAESGSHDIELTIETIPTMTITPTGFSNSGSTNLSSTVNANSEKILNDTVLGDLLFSASNLPLGTECTVRFESENANGGPNFKMLRDGGSLNITSDTITYTLTAPITRNNGTPTSPYTFVSGTDVRASPTTTSGVRSCELLMQNLTVASAEKLNNKADGIFRDTITYILDVN